MTDDRRPRRARVRVDREQAFQLWAALPHDARSYAAVARRFGISPRTVERYARNGGWQERLRRIKVEAAEQADLELGRDLARQYADFQDLIEATCLVYAHQLSSGEVKISAAEFVGLIKAALLLQGAPTARIETVTNTEEWARLRGHIITALAPFPEVRLALAEALEPDELEEEDGQARR